jgi:integrase
LVGDINDRLWQLIHVYLLELASQGAIDLEPKARAFLSWLKFIQSKKIDPFSSPPMKLYHPTYAYRHYLISRMNGDIQPSLASSTCASYINVIKSFYEFLINKQVIEGVFYKYKYKYIDGYRKIQSTDLSIRIRKNSDSSLNPLNEDDYPLFIKSMRECSVEYRLMIELMICSGFRLQESLTVTKEVFSEDYVSYLGGLARGLMIGPAFKVHTKFSLNREIFITIRQFNDISDYIESDRYTERKKKWRLNHQNDTYTPLFLSASGREISSKTFYSYWYRFLSEVVKKENSNFSHKPHDLRATFATNFLSLAIKCHPDMVDSCLDTVRSWMGHKSISTTLKYIKFINKRKVSDSVADVMDDFIEGIFSDVQKK